MFPILEVQNSPVLNNSIRSIKEYTINPNNPNALNNNDIIYFSMNHSDTLIWLEKGYFLVSGRLTTKSDAGVVGPAKKTSFVNGGILFLFNRAELRINNQTVEQVVEPGLTCIPKIYATYNDWSARSLQTMSWNRSPVSTVDGSFSNVLITFKLLFSMAEDFKYVLINPKVEVLLTRSRSDENVIFSTEDEVISLSIDKVQLKLPFVTPDDSNRLNLLRVIEKDRPLQFAFRAWELYQYPELPQSSRHTWNIRTSSQLEKPRYIVVFFLTDRIGNQKKNVSEYDHCDLRNIKLKLNNQSYPEEDMDQSFSKQDVSILYHMYCQFSASFNGLLESNPLVDYATFISKVPLAIIDCSRQPENIKYGPIDVRIDFEFNSPAPRKTQANCIILHDTLFEYTPLSNSIRKYEG